MASYAMGAFKLREERFDFEDAPTLVEVLALAFAAAARRAFASCVGLAKRNPTRNRLPRFLQDSMNRLASYAWPRGCRCTSGC